MWVCVTAEGANPHDSAANPERQTQPSIRAARFLSAGEILEAPANGNLQEFRLITRQTHSRSGLTHYLEQIATYQDILSLWKDADCEIPVLKEAKTEYAKLQ